ncbi:hypothetical protein A2U01_0087134, partial [Trifolium medium]|nr:hypothetical protein [Trifolium medium]
MDSSAEVTGSSSMVTGIK